MECLLSTSIASSWRVLFSLAWVVTNSLLFLDICCFGMDHSQYSGQEEYLSIPLATVLQEVQLGQVASITST